MKTLQRIILFLHMVHINGQFSNFFTSMMGGKSPMGMGSMGSMGMGMGAGSQNSATGSSGSSSCITSSVSCLPAPWCKRTVDKSGCPKCECGSGGMSSMMAGGSGKNNFISGGNPSLSSMFTSMLGGGAGRGFPGFPSFNSETGPMNPMAMVFGRGSFLGGGNGGPSGMGNFQNPMGQSGTGSSAQSNSPTVDNNKCDPAPYTCPVPPPWCQRLVDMDGCVKCYCGQKLQEYLQDLQGILTTVSSENETTTTIPQTQNASQTTVMTSTETSTQTTTTTTPPLGMSCLANFMCTLTCDNGYQTAVNGCPLCECIDNSPKSSTSDIPSTVNLPTDGSIITCPGIFDCQKLCLNGFQTDLQGCPLCQCVPD